MSRRKQNKQGKAKEIKIFYLSFLVLGFVITFPLLSFADSGASFLKLGVGARALGLGSAYTAVANDVTALHWNPAGLSQLTKREIGAMHAELFADSRLDFFGYSHPTRKGTWGIGAIYLTQGSLEGRSADRSQTGNFSASDLAVTIGAGRVVTSKTSFGVNLKIIQSQIADRNANGFAIDIGSLYHLTTLPLSLGLTIQNIGPQMKFLDEGYNMPLTFASGISYPLLKSLLVSADLKHQPYDSRTSFSIGTEFSPVSMLSLRAGYLTNAVRATQSNKNIFTEQVSNLSGLGLGVGFRLGSASMDYSFTPAGELGNTQRISLGTKF